MYEDDFLEDRYDSLYEQDDFGLFNDSEADDYWENDFDDE